MKLLFTLSLTAVAVVAGATWVYHQPKPEPEKVAQCIAAQLTPAEKTTLGASGAMAGEGEVIRIRRADFLGCRGTAAFFASEENRVALAKVIVPVMENSDEFRWGVQSAAWSRQGFRGALGAQLTSLSVQSGRQTVERVWGVGCNKVSPRQADELRDIELPLLTAMAGTQGWVASADRARLVAENIINQGKYHALKSAEDAGRDCSNPALNAGLVRQQEGATQFLNGVHPGAQGCKAVPEAGEFILTCGAGPK